MSNNPNSPYQTPGSRIDLPVSELSESNRSQFIMRTYNHLFVAIVAFVVIEYFLFTSGLAAQIAAPLLSGSWLLVLGAFMLVSWGASHLAHTAKSKAAQYGGLAALVIAYSIIFVPMLYIANATAPGAIQSAATLTLIGFGGLTAIAFITKKDFSFLRSILMWGGIVALVAIVGAILFGFHLGTWFSVAMVAFAGAAILYNTSNIINHFPEDRYVAGALELFSSVAMMFWYLLRFFMSDD